RCCIVTGEAKIPSLRGALAAGLITDLVIDERTARAMVDGREAA
ncbi:MAG: sugar-binding domain-containing protein, partial [Actinomycetota bacterium]|nr:sugar-binding domain-containing protein [Actinomycetota bacterium]